MRWNPRFSAIPVCLPVIITEPTMGCSLAVAALCAGMCGRLVKLLWPAGVPVHFGVTPTKTASDTPKDQRCIFQMYFIAERARVRFYRNTLLRSWLNMVDAHRVIKGVLRPSTACYICG